MGTKIEETISKLPSVDELRKVEALESDGEYVTAFESGASKAVRIEDGGGVEATIVFADTDILIYIYDNESDLNFYDGEKESADNQKTFQGITESLSEALQDLNDDLVWDWDDTGVIWATAAFWHTEGEWRYSDEWAEQAESSSDSSLTPLLDDLIKEA